MNGGKPVGVDLRVQAFPNPKKPAPPVEDDRICLRCGELSTAHHTALTEITEDPFGPTKTRFVLLCPTSTFASKSAPPKKRLRPVK